MAILAVCPVSIESGIQSGLIEALFAWGLAINARLRADVGQRQTSLSNGCTKRPLDLQRVHIRACGVKQWGALQFTDERFADG